MTAAAKGKTILLVHAGSESKRFILQRLKKMGLKVVCLNRERIAAADQYIDHWITADLNNEQESVVAIKHFLAKNPQVKLDGAVTFWDEAVLLTSKIIDTFGFIGIPYNVANTTKNKYTFREFCQNNNIRTPRHRLIHSKKDIPAIERALTYPMVVKPIYGACSAFVVKINNRQEFEETFDYVKQNIKSYWLAPEWQNLEFLVEEYFDGDEVDIDLLLQNGKIKFHSISDNFNKSRDRFFVDSGQAVPSALPVDGQQALLDLAEEILEKLGIQDACIHLEAKLSKDEAIPIEVNMRMGGDYIHSYIEAAWGVDLVEYSALIALGIYFKIDKPEVPHKYIVGWDLQPESSGILVELDVDDELNKKKYLEEIHLFKEIGDPILRPPEGYDSMGWLLVSGVNLLDAQDNLHEALDFINYKVVAFDEESALGKTSRKDSLSAAVFTKNRLLQTAKLEKMRTIPLKDQRNLRIGIAANTSTESAPSNHQAVVQDIEKELQSRGYRTTVFDFNNPERTLSKLRSKDIDLMLNVAHGINNNELLKPQAAALLEAMNIPFTGTDSLNIALARDKIRAKKLFTYHDIPTPAWDYAYTVNETINEDLCYPLIVKPADTDHSFGITNASVVSNKKELRKQLSYVVEKLGRPALVEEYIDGDEYSVSILGSDYNDLKVLPVARAEFKTGKNEWRICTADLKSGKPNAANFSNRPLKKLNPKLEALISEIAIDTYKVMKCRDFGRVELRVDTEGNPYVLEINSNPSLGKLSPIVRAAKIMGMSHGDLLEEIISLAITRYKNKKMLTNFPI